MLPALATAASSGRTFITAYCLRHGVSPTAAEDAVLITSELIGNAFLHAGSGTQVTEELVELRRMARQR